MPNTKLSPKALKKFIITLLVPLPVIGLICFLIGEHTLKLNLQHISHSYVNQIESIVDELRDENLQALYDAATCQQIQKDLLFEAFLREMVIIKDRKIVCSSKRSEIELAQIKHRMPASMLKSGEYLFDIPYDEGSVRSLLVVNQDKHNPDRSAISIIDQSYIDVRLGLDDDDRISQSVMTVSGEIYPSNSHIEANRFLTTSHSTHLNIQVSIVPSAKLKNELYANSILFSIPISLFLSMLWHLITYWYQTKGSLAEKIKKALKTNEFFLVYQPIIDSSTTEIKGIEALIRWNSSRVGFIGPDVFIPVAEQHGLINDITDFVLERVLSDWNENKTQNLHMSINVPPSYLSQDACLDKLSTFAQRYKTQGLKLCVEITERQLLKENDRNVLKEIQQMGVDVSIDDFGTGYTSLSVLQNSEFNYLKIDRCFINTIGIESVNSPVLDTIINLGHSMNVLMVAEGVETKEQADYLLSQGVQLLQGYYFYRPLSIEDILETLQH
ncbi:EAL domain-containing protein [Vibrio rumoiensis]|uniref:EAL domain-containing protein n=1 Tax=Vibrio rumoiensis TaxID=76258 RepID=UPI000B5C8F93|nr:EAL domain-containing protein [Vibrio rumoiensis]